MVAHLSREIKPSTSKAQADEVELPFDYQSRLSAILSAGAFFGTSTATEVRKALLVNLVVLAHHRQICERIDLIIRSYILIRRIGGDSRQLWIELCQKADVDPRDLINSNVEGLLKNVLEATNTEEKVCSILDHFSFIKSGSFKVPLFSEAGYRAVSTLAFVCPDVVLPHILSQVRSDITDNEASHLDPTDFAIWQTPEGTPYIDGTVK